MARVSLLTFGRKFQDVKTGSGADARASATELAAAIGKEIGENYTPQNIRDWLDSQVYSLTQKLKKANEDEKPELEKKKALFVELANVKIVGLPVSANGKGKGRKAKTIEEMEELFG